MNRAVSEIDESDRIILNRFIEKHFEKVADGDLSGDDQAIARRITDFVDANFKELTFVLGLAIDFAVVAQELSAQDEQLRTSQPSLTFDDIMERYELKPGKGGTDPNTLSLRFDDSASSYYRGIRGIENEVVELFTELNRTGYPSAAPHNTGQWRRFPDLIGWCFALSPIGRKALVGDLLEYGAKRLATNVFFGPKPRTRLFEKILTEYPRRGPNENAGLTFQALAYGFFSADRPHLDLVADKVRTGSARQKRFGDIDLYAGLEPSLSVEVKDGALSLDDYPSQFGRFVRNVEASGAFAIAFIHEATPDLIARLNDGRVIVMTSDDARSIVATWDWHKQDAAVSASLHYLSHVEQNTIAAKRLLAFIRQHDSEHDSLRYHDEPDPA